MVEESAPNRRFRENLRSARDERGWSQGELSRRLIDAGWPIFHQTTITRIENGTRAVKLDEAMAIADVLGTSLEELTQDRRTYMFRRAQQETWTARKELAMAGVEYMRRQLLLRSQMESPSALLGGAETVLEGPETERARQMIDETPGDAAMSTILLMMEAEGFSDYYVFREHWAAQERGNKRAGRTKDESGQEGGEDA